MNLTKVLSDRLLNLKDGLNLSKQKKMANPMKVSHFIK